MEAESGKTALIADDEQAVHGMIRHYLARAGLSLRIVDEAYSGRQAVSMAVEYQPDVIFLDIRMPVFDGFQVLDILRKEGVPSRCILITAYDQFDYAQAALRLGASDILLKPLKFEDFTSALERTIGPPDDECDPVRQILRYMDKAYASALTLDAVASVFGLSRYHLCRLLKKHAGQTFTGLLHGVRIREAERLLAETRLSIKEVAWRVGYRNLNNFYKHFTARFGVTPRAYRQREGKTG